MPKTNEPQKEETFESAMAALEKIVADMESDKMPLERLIVAYDEGAKLVKVCQARLADAERKIEIIQRRAGADPELKEFDPAAKTEAPVAQRSGGKDVSLF